MDEQIINYGRKPINLVNGRANGLEIREHFAGQIMQGLVNNNFTPTGFQNAGEKELAELSVKCADALLLALSKS